MTNETDLTYLSAAQPTVEIRVTGAFLENWIFSHLLARLAGSVIFLFGIAVFLAGWFEKKRENGSMNSKR